MGADDAQALRAIREAEAYEGASLVIAYSHCINQGLPQMKYGFEQQKKAVASGAWILYRYDPRLVLEGKNPLQLDYGPHKREDKPQLDIADYMYNEVRFKTLTQSKPEIAKNLLALARQDAVARWVYYKQLAGLDYSWTQAE